MLTVYMVGEVNVWLVGVGRLLHPEALAPAVRRTFIHMFLLHFAIIMSKNILLALVILFDVGVQINLLPQL